jgi:hypothetical protein
MSIFSGAPVRNERRAPGKSGHHHGRYRDDRSGGGQKKTPSGPLGDPADGNLRKTGAIEKDSVSCGLDVHDAKNDLTPAASIELVYSARSEIHNLFALFLHLVHAHRILVVRASRSAAAGGNIL